MSDLGTPPSIPGLDEAVTNILAELDIITATYPRSSTPGETRHLAEHQLVFDPAIDTVEFRPIGFVADERDQIAINPTFATRADPAIVADQLFSAVHLVRAFR